MRIGNIEISGKVIAAPMAGVTDACYRRILNDYGAAMTFTEMVSAKALVYGNEATKFLLRVCDKQSPTAAQLFGSEPAIMGKAAKIIADEFKGIALIDINCGCPAPKIVKNGEGAALMRSPSLIGEIAKEVVKAGLPVTVKIRKGFNAGDNTALEAAKAAEASGASAITVHGRTRSQMYSGLADWDVIHRVKSEVKIPVIGNGDVTSPETAAARLKEGIDAVMIGRGMWGNPWLIRRCDAFIETGILLPEPSPEERVEAALRHVHMLMTGKGQKTGIREARTHLHMYTKGLKGSASARVRLNRAENINEIREILGGLV